ncbi:hypothetical protein Agabi119p4_7465 [Agaricus bisporus var. burnettii]|uniref:Uncharacterized protein n=1 Tax=Agaricus bisporus var. burnettii TaxID=192524 RepID=A0A8H7C746_AGABI|nr:hypothetical protein Agabi119p4_7465 [Agaricus bisporus var. burnettii]
MTNKKANSSAALSNTISSFTQSATKAFHDLQAEVRTEVTRAEAEASRIRTERDQALKALQDSKKELQKHKEEILVCKASLKEADLIIKQHVDEFTILQRETNQWRDRAKNWQEHFLRVEEERCSLASRVDELEAERLAPPVALNPSKTIPSASTIQQPPTYHSAVPSPSQISREHQQARPSAKVNKRKAPSQSELPPYTETAQTPRTIKTAAAATSTPTSTIDRSKRSKQTGSSSSRPKKASSSAEVVEVPTIPQEPKQILIRRVHAVVEVKREEDSDEDVISATPPESLEVNTPRRSRSARRIRQIIDDDDYVPDGRSPGIESVEDDNDELMIAAGDDLSFDVGSPSVITRASTSIKTPNKRRKLNTTSSKTKRKT